MVIHKHHRTAGLEPGSSRIASEFAHQSAKLVDTRVQQQNFTDAESNDAVCACIIHSIAFSQCIFSIRFEKTFNKVPLERLMTKVEAHGIRGNYSRWIRNWLTGCTQRVVIHDQASDSTVVTSGVPQRSVLSPLLFIIYIHQRS
ncbi:Reverse transcriptase domain [Trinorchestia longiramus]|nr:Reverse transcriptase domain [Trinorchestia longiramus]